MKKLRYRHKIAAIMFVLTFIPLLILGSVLVDKTWNSKVQDVLEKNKAQLASGMSGMDNLLASSVDKIMFLNNNFYVYSYLRTNKDMNIVGTMSFSDYLQSIVDAMVVDSPNMDIAIYAINDTNYNGDYLRSIQKLENVEGAAGRSLKEEILADPSDRIVWKIRVAKDISGEDKEYIFAYKKINSIEKTLAIIEFRLPVDEILPFFAYGIPEGSYIVFDAERKRMPIRSASVGTLPPPGAEGDAYAIRLASKQELGQMTMYIPKSLIFKELKVFFVTAAVVFIVIVGILFLTVEVVSFLLTKRLEDLLRKMNTDIESLIGNDVLPIYATDDEFGKLGSIFYKLIRRIKEYYQKISEYMLEKTVLETQLLQERFNPHFLYNTLSSLRWISDDPRVLNVVDSMVKYYRIALNKGSSIITLAQEMEMIREYLKLQQFAYAKDFAYDIQIEAGIEDCLVLKHLLQPLVENAVLHGLGKRKQGGVISVIARKQRQDIVCEIADNGSGMDRDKVAQILHGENESVFIGYGMKNVRKRMEVFYKQGYGFEISSAPGRGTTVFISIPGTLQADPAPA